MSEQHAGGWGINITKETTGGGDLLAPYHVRMGWRRMIYATSVVTTMCIDPVQPRGPTGRRGHQ